MVLLPTRRAEIFNELTALVRVNGYRCDSITAVSNVVLIVWLYSNMQPLALTILRKRVAAGS
jgi:hypothetical protein